MRGLLGRHHADVAMGTSESSTSSGGPNERLGDDLLRAVSEADAENALVRPPGYPYPDSWYGYPVPLFVGPSGAYPGDKQGVTRRIRYT